MGFPDAEVRACLRASQGNPDVAVEYLMNGIPSFAQQIAASGGSGATSSAPAPGTNAAAPLQQLRDHPQINQLRQLVQSNPDTLQAVLSQIGQQQPELLQEINANQQLFLQIMNEPVQEEAPAPAAPAPSAGSTAGARPGPGGMLEAMQNPAQMAQMLQGMNPEQLATMSQMLGVSPEQLQGMVQMMSGMPQEELQEYMNMAMQGGGGGGGPRMGGGVPPGAQVLRLSEEEMAAVDRLADMGFDRTEAAQAYIACDKNEALAANLLMDGGFGFGGGDDGNNMGGNGGNNAGNDDDMYD
jgi:UV excision repair protein RAD23